MKSRTYRTGAPDGESLGYRLEVSVGRPCLAKLRLHPHARLDKLILLLGSLSCIAGCRFVGPPDHLIAYDGERKPPSEVAMVTTAGDSDASEIIKAPLLMGSSRVAIVNVDGREQPAGKDSVKLLRWVEVMPGPHTLTVVREQHDSPLSLAAFPPDDSPRALSFSAEAGHTYIVGGFQIRPAPAHFWIEDEATHATVAESKP